MMSEQSLMSSDTLPLEYGYASEYSLLSSSLNFLENSVSGNDQIIEGNEYEYTTEYEQYNGDFLLFNNQQDSNDFIIWNLFYGFGIALILALMIFFVKVCWDTFKKLS